MKNRANQEEEWALRDSNTRPPACRGAGNPELPQLSSPAKPEGDIRAAAERCRDLLSDPRAFHDWDNATIDVVQDLATLAAAYLNNDLIATLRPFAALGGPQPWAFPDLEDDVVIYSNSGRCVTAGDVRRARAAIAKVEAPHA
jgi:hypothetical protein